MVFIIVPVFNRLELTVKCLESIEKQTFGDYKVIVVDDGSTDGTAERIKKEFPRTEILTGNGNFYWTKCVNTAINYILPNMHDEDFILHVNNDTEFDSSYIQSLIDFHDKYPSSIIGSLSYDPDSKLISHLGMYHSRWTPFIKRNFREDEIDFSRLNNREYLRTTNMSARGLLIPAYVIKKIGLLDELNFPQYRSDEDYGIRCAQAGINVYISTKSVVYNRRVNTGLNHNIHTVTIQSFYRSFFSLLSTNNLHIRWNWAKKNSAIPPVYYLLDVAKLVGGYFKSILYRKITGRPIK